jgi:group I intron endonuclease
MRLELKKFEVIGVIYSASCRPTGKRYIGKTTQSLYLRRKAHESESRTRCQTFFHRALQKYGFHNFEWTVLEKCSSSQELNFRECHWIAFHQTLDSKYGFNQAPGGLGGAYTLEHRRRISLALKGRPTSVEVRRKLSEIRKGKPLTEAIKLRMSLSKRGSKNHFYGKRHSAETKRLIGSKSNNRNWAKGSQCGSWKNADAIKIAELFFQKLSIQEIANRYFRITGEKIGAKIIVKSCNQFNLPIRNAGLRGRAGRIFINEFIDSHEFKNGEVRPKELQRDLNSTFN